MYPALTPRLLGKNLLCFPTAYITQLPLAAALCLSVVTQGEVLRLQSVEADFTNQPLYLPPLSPSILDLQLECAVEQLWSEGAVRGQDPDAGSQSCLLCLLCGREHFLGLW